MSDWAVKFCEETKMLREEVQHLLLLLNEYGAHLQYKTLKYLKGNGIIVVALPAHTSHVIQPVDVSVFSSYKSTQQANIHRAARAKKGFGCF